MTLYGMKRFGIMTVALTAGGCLLAGCGEEPQRAAEVPAAQSEVVPGWVDEKEPPLEYLDEALARAEARNDGKEVCRLLREYITCENADHAGLIQEYSLLAFAAAHGYPAALRYLIATDGTDWQNACPEKLDSPLCLAAEGGHADCVRILLEAGFKPEDCRYDSPYTCALSSKNPECIRLLHEACRISEPICYPDPEEEADCARHATLEAAIAGDCSVCVERLVKAGADVNAELKPGFTPLMLAASFGRAEHLRLLLEAGAEVNVQTPGAPSALHYALEWRTYSQPQVHYRQMIECVRLLLEAGADASCCQEFGTTPLHLAARRCMAETVSRMLADGADPNALGTACYGAGKEITPLEEALECSSTMMVLLENGADITPYKDTILWLAADRSPRVIRKLLELGANPAARGADGTSVLDLVVREGNEEKIRLIREALQHSRRKRR